MMEVWLRLRWLAPVVVNFWVRRPALWCHLFRAAFCCGKFVSLVAIYSFLVLGSWGSKLKTWPSIEQRRKRRNWTFGSGMFWNDVSFLVVSSSVTGKFKDFSSKTPRRFCLGVTSMATISRQRMNVCVCVWNSIYSVCTGKGSSQSKHKHKHKRSCVSPSRAEPTIVGTLQ